MPIFQKKVRQQGTKIYSCLWFKRYERIQIVWTYQKKGYNQLLCSICWKLSMGWNDREDGKNCVSYCTWWHDRGSCSNTTCNSKYCNIIHPQDCATFSKEIFYATSHILSYTSNYNKSTTNSSKNPKEFFTFRSNFSKSISTKNDKFVWDL